VRRSPAVLTLTAAVLISSCGGGAPTSPSQLPPGPTPATSASLVGAWRGSVQSTAVRAVTGTTVGFALNCSGRLEISSQSSGHFDGTYSFEGGGPDSDWRCTRSGRISGQLTADNRVTIDFVPPFSPGGCTNIVGGDRGTGSRSDDSIVVALPYKATCTMALGGDAPSWDLEIAATVTLVPW
jgi:hypothetical protein